MARGKVGRLRWEIENTVEVIRVFQGRLCLFTAKLALHSLTRCLEVRFAPSKSFRLTAARCPASHWTKSSIVWRVRHRQASGCADDEAAELH